MKPGLTASTRRTPYEGPRATSNAEAEARPQKVRKKKERNAAETKRRILEAAVTEFAGKGFDGARLGSIARTAGVQQALIHHYFADKEGLHAEVVHAGLQAMTEGVWDLLARMDTPRAPAKKAKQKNGGAAGPSAADVKALREIATAFVELMVKFFATNGTFLQILRNDARASGRGDAATAIVTEKIGPVFEGIVARLDAMRERGEVRADVDARHLVLSAVAMVAFPFQEETFVSAIWPGNWHSPESLHARTTHVVDMVLARVAP